MLFSTITCQEGEEEMDFDTNTNFENGKKLREMEFGPGVTVNFLEHDTKQRNGARRVRFARTNGYLDHDSSFGMQVLNGVNTTAC